MRSSLRAAVRLVILAAVPGLVRAQWQGALGPNAGVVGAPAGSDMERYLRALTIAGVLRDVPFGIRGLDTDAVGAVLASADSTPHPWQDRLAARPARAAVGAAATVAVNSGFPWGRDDGPMWQGAGATVGLAAGATVRFGAMRATLAPVIAVAQNRAYPLVDGPVPFGHPVYPFNVDLPQRFGDLPYALASLGESSVRLRLRGVDLALTSAAPAWGPGGSYPLVLGPNAGGFPRVSVSSGPRGIRIPLVGRVAGQYLLGVLDQSAWSSVAGADTFSTPVESGRRRLATGLTVSWLPSLLPGLEVGASRFFNSPWRGPSRRWRGWSKPFEGIFKSEFTDRNEAFIDPTGDIDNQLASVHARWVFPRRGVEATFEFFRDDHSWDMRDLAQEPEQNSALAAAVRVVTHRSPSRLGVLTLEYLDGDVRRIAQQRPQGFLYLGWPIRQGHTLRGQLLGQGVGVGAVTAQRIAWERFTPQGSLRWWAERTQPLARGADNDQSLYFPAEQFLGSNHDWILDLGAGATRLRRGQAMSLEGGLAIAGIWQLQPQSRLNLYVRASFAGF